MGNLLTKIRSTEPAAFAEFVRAVLAALVGAGWLTIDDTTINTVVSVVGLLTSFVLTHFVRKNVMPVTDFKAGEHRPSS
ncbi:hypothetical protein [Amycolatopsis minnesotensis]|uniref:Holin n=1 Tax=Amycolatopsis minnesotensis TaxID=337894 RepID=A0ABN2Q1E6_9PSEU